MVRQVYIYTYTYIVYGNMYLLYFPNISIRLCKQSNSRKSVGKINILVWDSLLPKEI